VNTTALPEHPNLVLIITDQERAPMHWPDGFAESHLTSRNRLLRHGLSFDRAICNSTMCSPSRATLFTGLMPAQHRVIDTLTDDGPYSFTETQLSDELPNLATMLRAGGYDVHYRGKWHLSKGPKGGFDVTAEQVAAYGFDGWIAPDGGGDTRPESFGGGRADHDAPYITQALEFLQERARAAPGAPPFFLVLSLINPHDVLAFPRAWQDDYEPQDLEGTIELPPTVDEDLAANHKPAAHAQLGPAIDFAVGPLQTRAQQRQYLNFYTNLTVKADRQLAPVVDCFYQPDGTPTELGQRTVIVRLSDHGELAMAHGGLRQKAFNIYEESLRVPLIVANPILVPDPRSCSHPASLVDVMPTVAGLLQLEPPTGLRGADLSPVVRDPGTPPVQDEVLYTFDDMHAGTGLVKEVLPGAAGRIRCIREARFKFARYFHAEGSHPTEYEMYDLDEDGFELENLAHPDHPRYDDREVAAQRDRLAAKLAELEERLARPVPA
jgi:arylsulfatase A-like enzyme